MAVLFALLVGALTAPVSARAPPGGGNRVRELDLSCKPLQVHLALGPDPTKMHVSWKTRGGNCASSVTWSRGLWLAGALPWSGASAEGYSFLMSQRDMCDEPAAANPFALYLHRAVMTGLAPGAYYRYAVGGAATSSRCASTPASGSTPGCGSFRSAPRDGGSGRVSFIAFGDLGDPDHAAAKSPGAAATLATIMRRDARDSDLVLHVGDLSYADGDPDIWDSFMDAIEPIAARVPWMIAVGNHEVGYTSESGAAIDPSGLGPYVPSWGNYGADSGGECGVMAARRFHMPSAGRVSSAGGVPNPSAGRDNAPFWFAYTYGSVRFVTVSSEHDLSPGSTQYTWLAAALAAVDRCATPWVVLLIHRPLLVVYPHKSNRQVGEHLRASLEPLLERFLVDLVVSGHVHTYYRTCPVMRGECLGSGGSRDGANVGGGGSSGSSGSSGSGSSGVDGRAGRHGTVHVVVGSAGRKLSRVEDGQEAWLAAGREEYGYARFVVDSDEVLRGEFVASEGGDVLDSFQVTASPARLQRTCPPPRAA